MRQSRLHSFWESIQNVLVGYFLSLASLYLILPPLGVETGHSQNLLISLYFTGLSLARSYLLRRYNERKLKRLYEKSKNQIGG